ncbi:UPF0114 domain containing protein [Musa troglodytarum]|uniref:UPF0114 domain containing protein n=1 Tax=Musa troglodytarum TaxID=320322 RepID=A0A9E7EK32_9LILI|nr:UPF0114 domain containing protein [Musa troglodytarum]
MCVSGQIHIKDKWSPSNNKSWHAFHDSRRSDVDRDFGAERERWPPFGWRTLSTHEGDGGGIYVRLYQLSKTTSILRRQSITASCQPSVHHSLVEMASTVLPMSVASPATPVPAVRRNFAFRLRRASHVCCLGSSSAPFSASPSSTHSQSHGESITKIAADPGGNVVVRLAPASESTIERVIFDFRFLALLAVGGSLAGSVLCFLNGCVYIVDAYKVYWSSCLKGVHTGQMVLRLVEAIDVYLAGTVMLIFGMGLYGLFISNVPPGIPSGVDRALKGSSLFGMFALKERPKWMQISSLDELKTKVGHVIVMILLVKMFERSKMVDSVYNDLQPTACSMHWHSLSGASPLDSFVESHALSLGSLRRRLFGERRRMNRQQRNASALPTPAQVSHLVVVEKERKSGFLHRAFPLLLLTLYAVGSVLRLALSSPFPSSFVQPSAASSFSAEPRQDVESLRTHIASETNHLQVHEENPGDPPLPCSARIDGRTEGAAAANRDEALVCCDRNHVRSDLCYARGDVRTDSRSSSILVYGAADGKSAAPATEEKIRPYTRKWDTEITRTIQEISIRPMPSAAAVNGSQSRACDVRHEGLPGLLLSNGGYTGNLYHEFSDGLIPLYVTAQRFKGEVVLVVAEHRPWWLARYGPVLQRLTNYELVDFNRDTRVHCFSEMIVGLRIHGELIIDPWLMPNGNSIQDFQALLREGYSSVVQPRTVPPETPPFLRPLLRSSRHDHSQQHGGSSNHRPRIAIFVRKGCRVLLNLREVVRASQRIGFDVQLIEPKRATPLDVIYRALAPADVMLAVHGAAMTHFLFMRPAAVLIQIVPLGLEKPAEEFYGGPARRLGLEYMAYNITPEESSLSKLYDRQSPVLLNTSVITSKGWMEMKKIYLDKQNVRVNVKRFTKLLAQAHTMSVDYRKGFRQQRVKE